MDNLLIITGAGASHDVVLLPNALVNTAFQSPLTKDLFDDSHTCISDCLVNHPVANNVGYGLKLRLNSASPEESLESSLLKIKNSELPTIKNQFWSIPLYLHDLFEQISDKFLRTANSSSPSNYKVLIDAIIESNYRQIIWINLNYDLLADRVLALTTKSELTSLEDYMNLKTLEGIKIKYTKPHGSVNWYRLTGNSLTNHSNNWENIRCGRAPLEDFENKLSGEIFTLQTAHEVIADYEKVNKNRPSMSLNNSFYPAISVPLGEYKYTCQEHIDAIIPDLKNTESVLCIGFSALDLDILNLIKDNIPKIKKLRIVNGSHEDCCNTFNRIKNICNNVTVEKKDAIFPKGFTQFVSKDISNWLNE